MSTTSFDTKPAASSCLSLRICAPDGHARSHELPAGQVLVVGSSPACGLRLDSPEIAGMHCTIEFNDGRVTVRDWNTEAGTYLDGQPIDEQRVGGASFELRIAGYLIQARLSALGAVPELPPPTAVASSDTAGSAAGEQSQFEAEEATDADECGGLGEEGLGDEDGPMNGGDAWDRDFDPWDTPEQARLLSASPAGERTTVDSPLDEIHDDIREMLQTEVEFLRSELAERDERLRGLEEFAANDPSALSDEDMVPASDVERLVARLEQLLAELEQSDARIAALNELLRTSEEAVQTADQERKQLEGWLCEVDRRVGQWEQEWHAERDALKKTIAELTEQRDCAEQQLANGGASAASGAAGDQLVSRLREEYSRLKSSYLKIEQERDRLQSRLEDVSVVDAEQRVTAAVDAALREERLQLAQETASLAREKAALAKRQEEIQAQLDRKAQSGDSADHRIRAFREHLRELHETEPRAQGPTLSQRMGKLWRKLEGRPLDTD